MSAMWTSVEPVLTSRTSDLVANWPHWCRIGHEAALAEFAAYLGEVARATYRDSTVEVRLIDSDGSAYAPIQVDIAGDLIEIGLPSPTFKDDLVDMTRAHRLLPVMVILAVLARQQGKVATSFTLAVLDDNPNADVGFCDCRDTGLLIPDSDFIRSGGYAQFRLEVERDWTPWESRSAAFVWRGSTTGKRRPPHTFRSTTEWYKLLPRLEVCARLGDEPWAAFCDVGISLVVQIDDRTTIERIERELKKDFIPRARQIGYRHHLDIDGNSNAWTGLMQGLIMGGCVAKVASPGGFRQWYYGELKPFGNFVPIDSDLSNLEAAIDWCLSHPDRARAIAMESRALAHRLTFDQEIAEAANRIAAVHSRT